MTERIKISEVISMTDLNLTSHVVSLDAIITVHTTNCENQPLRTTFHTNQSDKMDSFAIATSENHPNFMAAVSYHLFCVEQLESGMLPTPVGWVKPRDCPNEDELLRALEEDKPMSPEDAFIAIFNEDGDEQ